MPFSAAMLSWPPGPRHSDGVWAPYWYDSVWRSTGFTPAPLAGPPAARTPLDPAIEGLLERCLPYYEKMRKNKIEIGVPNGPG